MPYMCIEKGGRNSLDKEWEICMDVVDQFCVSLLLRWYLCACSSEGVSARTTRSATLGGLLLEMSGKGEERVIHSLV